MFMFGFIGIGWRTGGWSRVVSSRLPSKGYHTIMPVLTIDRTVFFCFFFEASFKTLVFRAYDFSFA
jgi:hypothetical protein